MTLQLHGISSMATRALLAEMAAAFTRDTGSTLRFESVGGVDAAERVRQGEAFDLVVLAESALEQLQADGHVDGEARVVGTSAMGVATAKGVARPRVDDVEALREALLAAPRIAYSTGPSGTALLKLLERWQLGDVLKPRLVQARPGVPVAALLAAGEASLGFQQISELQGQPGIEVLGPMPPGAEVITRFLGAVAASSRQGPAARVALSFIAGPDGDAIRRAHGMSNTTTCPSP